ncbi:wall-associated receptor kinase 4-like [Zingiber officinale]|uniref:wall-associated receptor kinase 4-like n=1 Tax=Zingiber officinale TaxID=94328 RepID=UPI001C4B2B29|nr:wall-associated receptor kinase 4-like [Zingiber officinale]
MMMMTTMKNMCVICMLLVLLLAVSYATEAEESACTRLCGDVYIPFPFGIETGCFATSFRVSCNTTDFKLYYGNTDIQIVGIDHNNFQATILQPITADCPNNNRTAGSSTSSEIDLTDTPFYVNNTRNIFTAIGCGVDAFYNASSRYFSDFNMTTRNCVSLCNTNATFVNSTCSGNNGCCQTSIPPLVEQFTSSLSNSGASSSNSCSYSFLVDRSWFSLNGLTGQDFYERNEGLVPVVVYWFSVGDPVYRDQLDRRLNLKLIFIIISTSAGGSLLIILAIITLRMRLRQRNLEKKRKENYSRNLQLLRNAPSSSPDDIVIERMKIYKLDEMEKATNNFDKTRIIGGGGHGNVYKGILSDQRVVAIKRPKIMNEIELGQFINEVFILSQTSHRNVVKFFGCCLETEVPLLVFEFISGGTLSDHLIDREQHPPLSFEDRLRIAYEIARALSYIHSEASITIFHRDIKSSNILLDERNIAKLADFGASRVVTCEMNSVTTIVQGTYGYLDPEYHQTGRLTEKSDVYSFGVILAELLTGRAAIPYQKNNEVRHLVMDFLGSLKEKSLHEILDPIVLNQAKEEIVERMARLVERCLKLKGNKRPMMKEVEDVLEAMREKKSDIDIDANCGVGGVDCFVVVQE